MVVHKAAARVQERAADRPSASVPGALPPAIQSACPLCLRTVRLDSQGTIKKVG